MPERPNPKRIFLGWDRPVLDLAVDWLSADWQTGPFDLHEHLILVPTAQSARRLREALATAADRRGTGVLAPTVLTPDAFLEASPKSRVTASQLECLAVWVGLLRRVNVARYPNLFPPTAPTPSQDFAWGMGVARKIVELRLLLGERGLSIAEAGDELSAAFEDPERWEAERWGELVELERLYVRRLDELELEDPVRARRMGARTIDLPATTRHITMIAVPDPLPLAIDALSALPADLSLTLLIHAPEALADQFDAWGRPTEDWQSPECQIDIPDEAIHLVARPQNQGQCAVGLLSGKPWRDCAIGVADTDVVPHLKLVLREADVPAHDPAGQALSQTPLYGLIETLVALASQRRFEDLADLMRHPHVMGFLHDHGVITSSTGLLAGLDRLQSDHLCTRFESAMHWAVVEKRADQGPKSGLPEALALVGEWLQECQTGLGSTGGILAVLRRIYAQHELHESRPEDRLFADAAALINDYAAALSSPTLETCCPDAWERTRLVLEVMGSQRLYPDAEDSGVELDGWLELHWNDARHLVVTGMNEGRVPESVVGHVFLPDAARRHLGLLHNDRRLARDAYLLTALVRSRPPPGEIHLVLGKVNADNDALRPSRLLFRCPETELPGRALRLFRELEHEGDLTAWQRCWQLRPPAMPPPESTTVTALRDYLACPFRFYLKRVMRMERLDDRKAELDAMDFGNVCHIALDRFAEEKTLRDSTDPERIGAFLVEEARAYVSERFGPGLPPVVTIQLASACQRLRAAARVQAEQRAAGWQIVDHEYAIADGRGVTLEGLIVRGVVDRIDRHSDGTMRVLDYKTSEKATLPAEQHLGSMPREAEGGSDPLQRVVEVHGKPYRWCDLQLPLYALFLTEHLGQQPQCGYFVLPKAVTETAVHTWTELSTDLLESAERCATAVARAIHSGVFWPPAENPRYDDFADLFQGTAADSVAPDSVPGLEGSLP